MQTNIPYKCDTGPRTYTIEFSTKLLNQMKMIEEWRGFMKALRLLNRGVVGMADDHVLMEALASVRIEGATVDTQRAREMIENEITPETKSELEFVNYFSTLSDLDAFAGKPGAKKEVIREMDLRQCHARITEGTLGDPATVGQYRTGSVKIATKDDQGKTIILHEPPDALEIPELMRGFLDWLNQVTNGPETVKLPALVTAALVHYEFVRIHPFIDGNGRTARLLTSLVLLQRGYDFRDLFCITEYYDQNRDKYTVALGSVDHPRKDDPQTFDATTWVSFFCGALALQMKQAEYRVMDSLKD